MDALSLEEARKLVDELYDARDRRFVQQGKLKEQQQAVLCSLGNLGGDVRGVDGALLKGRTLNVLDEYSEEAERELAGAVKLDPSSVDSWNALGSCFWKKGDIHAAQNCFESALEQRSVDCAKEAVAINVGDGASWYVLGNAYATLFFDASRDPRDLQRALSAYSRAILAFLQEYRRAVECYRRAASLDPALPAQDAADTARRQAIALSNAVAKRAAVKRKRIAAIVGGLGRAVGAEDMTTSVVADLREGENASARVPLALLMTVCRPGQTPACYACVDAEGECAILTVYNFDSDALRAATSKHAHVVAVEPRVKLVDPGFAAPFRSLQIAKPSQLLVGGKPMREGFVHARIRAQTQDA